ncbi:MAG: ATP-binding protein [Nostoc sp.]|uniref:ATP-binding protein n=1 Tax=Nostoc sp. TaxID=1180 RepID=UPI002FF5A5DD
MSAFQFLLLEANLTDAQVVQATLLEGSINCELLRVETRADFIRILETDEIDLILADYALSGFDGIAALTIAHSLRPEMPFIFISGSLGEELAIEAIKQGATDYVLKQRLGRLVPSVQRALQEAQERKRDSLLGIRDWGSGNQTKNYVRGFNPEHILLQFPSTQRCTELAEVYPVPSTKAAYQEPPTSGIVGDSDARILANAALSPRPVDKDTIDRKQALSAVESDLKDTQLLHELSARLVTEGDIQTLYQEIMAAAIALTRADAGTVQILDEATQELVLLATQGFERNLTEHFYRVNASSNTPCGIALKNGDRTFIDFDVPKSEDPDGSMQRHVDAGYLSAQSTPLITRLGKPIGMVSTHWREHYHPSDGELRFLDLLARQAADLIEQRQAQAALRESEEKYRSLFTTMAQGFCIIEKIETVGGQPSDFRYLTANPAFEHHTGMHDVVGKTIRELVPDAEQPIMDIYDEVVRTGQPQQFEGYVAALDLWMEAEVFPAQMPGQIAVLFSNVSERKQAEEQLRRAAEMDAFRVKLSDALRSLADPVQIQTQACCLLGEHLSVDRTYYVEVNDAQSSARVNQDYLRGDSPSLVGVFRLTDYGWIVPFLQRGETIIVADTENSDIIPEADREAMAAVRIIAHISIPLMKAGALVGALCITESAPREWSATEIELVRETAERIWATIERACAEAAMRKSEIQRIREQAAREEECQRAESLAELDRAKTLFFSNVSHEFRTPLTLILAPLQDALSDSVNPLTSSQREQLELAHRNSLRLLKLVNTLLDFSRIEADGLKANYEPTDLSTYTAELASVFRSAIENANLQLVVDCPPLPDPIFVDREMWEKIVLNLLSNALKFTFEGIISVSLKFKANTVDQEAREQGAGSREQGAGSREQGAGSREQGAGSREQGAGSREQGTGNREQGAGSREQGAREKNFPLCPPHPAPLPLLHAPCLFVELMVSDTGVGISASELPHLFERFYQVKGAKGRSYEGSGIGLSLVQELVKRHGGAIAVTSAVDQGTTFTVTIPTGIAHLPADQIWVASTLASTAVTANTFVDEALRWLPEESTEFQLQNSEVHAQSSKVHAQSLEVHPQSLEVQAQSLEVQAQSSKRARILLVDDNADIRRYLRRLLNQYYEVETVNDGLAALTAIRRGGSAKVYDLVLADVMMPRMDGFELLRSLRASPDTQTIPIILLSARAGEESRVEGLETGADDYLIKPFSARELLARVNANLQLAQLRREAVYREQVMQAVETLNDRLEQQVKARTAQLEAINQELEAFSSLVSHDLRTPLRYISSFAERLQGKLNATLVDASSLQTLNIITKSALEAEKMVDDLLEFSRLGKTEIHSKTVIISQLVQQVREQLQPELIGRSLHWEIEPLATVKADPALLRLVLQNLLSNAVKYSRNNTEAAIKIGSIEQEQEVIFFVKDNGAGFDMKYYDGLFSIFQRLHPQEEFAGTGVGLATVRRIIDRHGGRIWAEGATGQGATFYFSLPKHEA